MFCISDRWDRAIRNLRPFSHFVPGILPAGPSERPELSADTADTGLGCLALFERTSPFVMNQGLESHETAVQDFSKRPPQPRCSFISIHGRPCTDSLTGPARGRNCPLANAMTTAAMADED
jgi:hypothetical protein